MCIFKIWKKFGKPGKKFEKRSCNPAQNCFGYSGQFLTQKGIGHSEFSFITLIFKKNIQFVIF